MSKDVSPFFINTYFLDKYEIIAIRILRLGLNNVLCLIWPTSNPNPHPHPNPNPNPNPDPNHNPKLAKLHILPS